MVNLSIIQNYHQCAYKKINEELVSMYFEIGKCLSEKVRFGIKSN
ncbi:MAG: hypothetical protein IKB70_00710 [Bacilli bacterium]|nr:hypothetical protein [Bacilli bacterium]